MTGRVVFVFSLPFFFSLRKATSNVQVVNDSRLENNKTPAIFLFFHSTFFAQLLQVCKAADGIPVKFLSQKR